ncbi:MAG: CAP domain-containing protein [Polyangiaceae bacterium]
MNAKTFLAVLVGLAGPLFVMACDGGTGSGAGGEPGGNNDPLEATRQACVDKINELRATKGLPALTRWKEAESCVDQQATEDAQSGSAHGAWISGKYDCNGSGQNECPGWGAEGVVACLDSMWSEKDQAACSGCDACADAYNPTCPSCDFYGSTSGMTCGHYVNLSAKYVTKVACGFSAQGGWDAINFQ